MSEDNVRSDICEILEDIELEECKMMLRKYIEHMRDLEDTTKALEFADYMSRVEALARLREIICKK